MNDDAAILLIEDSDTQALQLRRMFERAGFRIDRTRDAETALETLNHSRPDLLVVDYRLPGMNGDELVRIVRQTGATRTLPILMLTGDDASDVERQGLDSGANAYVPKRGGAELILSRVRALLRQVRARPLGDGPAAALRQARLLLLAPQDTASDQLVSDLAAEGYHVGHVAGIADTLKAIDEEAADGILVVEQPGDPSFGLSAKLDARRTARASGVALVALTDDAEPATVLAGLAA